MALFRTKLYWEAWKNYTHPVCLCRKLDYCIGAIQAMKGKAYDMQQKRRLTSLIGHGVIMKGNGYPLCQRAKGLKSAVSRGKDWVSTALKNPNEPTVHSQILK